MPATVNSPKLTTAQQRLMETLSDGAWHDSTRRYPAALLGNSAAALDSNWSGSVRVDPLVWEMPAGAFGEASGPS